MELRPRPNVNYAEHVDEPKNLCCVADSVLVFNEKGLFAVEDIDASPGEPVWVADFGNMSSENQHGEHAWGIREANAGVVYENGNTPSLASRANNHCCACMVTAVMHRHGKKYSLFLYKSVKKGEEILLQYGDQAPSLCYCCREEIDTKTAVKRMICVRCGKPPIRGAFV